MMKLSVQLRVSLSSKKWHWGQKQAGDDFVTLATQAVDSLAGVRAKSTIDNYRTALRSFHFFKERNTKMKGVDAIVLENYQCWLSEKGVTLNTISCYMRSLRSLIHKVLPENDEQRLFRHVFTGKETTAKRAITIAEMNRLRQLALADESALAFSRDLFLFSFYALGMPFVDMAFLKKSQVVDGYILYQRHKTNQRISIRIEQPMQAIMDRYRHEDSLYVFPILKSAYPQNAVAEYETARRRYNRHLKRLGIKANMGQALTSYVARHSWASIAYHANVDLNVISKALGHTSPNTTLTYIRTIDNERIDAANRLLLEQMK